MGRPWRERLVTALLVVVIAVPVGIVIGGGLQLGGGSVDDGAEVVAADEASSSTSVSSASDTTEVPASSSTTTTTTSPKPPARPPSEVRLQLANGSRTAGAAVTVGARLKADGYRVVAPAPSPKEPVAATTITYRDGFATEASALADRLGVTGVAATPMARPPATVDVVVVLGDDAVSAIDGR